MKIYEVKPSPATKSSIDGLERVRLDRSEASGECVICSKLFEPGVEVIHLLVLKSFTCHTFILSQRLHCSVVGDQSLVSLVLLLDASLDIFLLFLSRKWKILSTPHLKHRNGKSIIAANILQYTDLEQVYCR